MRRTFVVLIVLSMATLTQVSVTQQRLGDRITGVIDEGLRSVLKGHLNLAALPQLDRGRANPQRIIPRITMEFKRTDEQQANLDAFLNEQRTRLHAIISYG